MHILCRENQRSSREAGHTNSGNGVRKVKRARKRLKLNEVCFVIKPNYTNKEIYYGIAALNDVMYGSSDGRVVH